MDLDDALALTDEDALAKDMFSRPSMNTPPSAYMQAHVPARLPCQGALKTHLSSCSVVLHWTMCMRVGMASLEATVSSFWPLRGTMSSARLHSLLKRDDSLAAQPSQVPLHDVRVEGQWKRVKEEGQSSPFAATSTPRQ